MFWRYELKLIRLNREILKRSKYSGFKPLVKIFFEARLMYNRKIKLVSQKKNFSLLKGERFKFFVERGSMALASELFLTCLLTLIN